jgi:putative transposase
VTLDAIDRAVNVGARLESACEQLGLSARTIQRWRAQGGGSDLRVGSVSPANRLSDEGRALVPATANSPEFRDVGPKQMVPVLADRAVYVASESTFYRILKGAGQMTYREPSKPAAARPRELTATAPCQVWSWDITYLHSPILGQFF